VASRAVATEIRPGESFAVPEEPALGEVEWACRRHFDFAVAAPNAFGAASTGETSKPYRGRSTDLQLLGANVYLS
jgi:hypothetical protein